MKLSHFGKLFSRCAGPATRLATMLGLITASAGVLAQEVMGTLQYGPPGSGGVGPGPVSPTAIPTLGGAGLVLLSAFFLLLFWRMHRRGAIQGTRFMTIALLSGALASGLGGVKLVSDAIAQTVAFRDMTSPSGGSLDFVNQSLGCVRNATDVDLEVLAMTGWLSGYRVNIDSGCEVADLLPHEHDRPACAVGTVLAPDEVCGAGMLGGNASDMRLKADISAVGTHESGLTLYEFRYIGGTTRYRGVMAQDVLRHTPEAVTVMPNGYLAVNYGLLGLEMTEVR